MKRFTETAKWDDPWWHALSPRNKLAWQYLCDKCDAVGVIDLNRALADFQIGDAVDWDAFIELSGARLRTLPNGKLWLTGFIAFQYGKLSTDCKAHRPVFSLIEKHGIGEWVSKGYPVGSEPHKEKDKEKEKDKDKELEGECRGETNSFDASRERFTDLWNGAAGVRPVTVMSSPRDAMLRTRLTESLLVGDEPVPWLDALAWAIAHKFPLKCARGDPSGWRPDANWILKPDSLPKILEGAYDWSKNDGRRNDIGPGQRFDPAAAQASLGDGW